jgi:hypothetical protein
MERCITSILNIHKDNATLRKVTKHTYVCGMLDNTVEYQINCFHHLQRIEENIFTKRVYHYIHWNLGKYESDQTIDRRVNSNLDRNSRVRHDAADDYITEYSFPDPYSLYVLTHYFMIEKNPKIVPSLRQKKETLFESIRSTEIVTSSGLKKTKCLQSTYYNFSRISPEQIVE